jgi:hypothetical protein
MFETGKKASTLPALQIPYLMDCKDQGSKLITLAQAWSRLIA